MKLTRTWHLILTVLVSLLSSANAEEPSLRVLRSSRQGTPLLANGGFEQSNGERLESWRPWRMGFTPVAGEGRHGSTAIMCKRSPGGGEFGASQTLPLDREAPWPLVVRGWSKSAAVSGSPDSGYSLYVDILYTDGTPLWGQTENFRCGTHDWEKREFVILPEKPVKTMTLHCLFRNHTGMVWFDDVSVEEIRPQGDILLFQGMPVELVESTRRQKPAALRTLSTRDGLELTRADHGIQSLRLDGNELLARRPAGFLARDAARDTDFFGLSSGSSDSLGLKLETEYTADASHISIRGQIADTTGKERAVLLAFALPIDARGWRWGDDIRRSRPIQGAGEYTSSVTVRCGSTGTMSLSPIAPIYNDDIGMALALDMGSPAVYRLAYNAGTGQLIIAYDFGLSPVTRKFPGSAAFHFVLYRFDPQLGFRGALEKYQRIFPDYFTVRSRDQGIWMPFTDISTVEGWRDFGFKYHEGTNNVTFDDSSSILSFRYTEPMTWWMPMNKTTSRTPSEASKARDRLEKSASGRHRRMAAVTRLAGMRDEAGDACLVFRDTPWCNGAVWSLNPNPRLPGELNAATVYWNEDVKQRLYGPGARGTLDGEYLDSLEGYVTAELNFRAEHFIHTTVPLTFSRTSHRPALFKGLAIFEFTRWISRDIHGMGKLMFANSVPYRFSYLCPLLDVMGTETNWLRGNKYQPPSHARLCLWRSMTGAKPYLLLMNTDYDSFTPDLVERYFQASLFYGFYPSMFSHNASENPYWKNPDWYNRDRHLFKKYIPIIRHVAQAGWQPVTHAACDNPAIWVERFGPDAHDAVYFTILNDTAESQSGVLEIDAAALNLEASSREHPFEVHELLSKQKLAGERWHYRLELRPGECQAIKLSRK